jgi:hypothetical protein
MPQLYRVVLGLALAMPGFGQVTEASLRTLYGNPVNGSYTVSPGVTIATSDGPQGEVCVLKIVGATTEGQVLTIYDKAVPASARGLALGSMLECVGACKWDMNYEKMTMSYAVMKGQISDPAAIVSFKNKSCKERVKEAEAKGFSIRVTNPSSK